MDWHRPGFSAQVNGLKEQWANEPMWKGIKRNYTAEEVVKLRIPLKIEYTLGMAGAERLWHLLNTETYVPTFGALMGSQAVQMVKAGLKAIYVSGWQVAADSNMAAQTYPDQSLYPANSVPALVKRLNNALIRGDQISSLENTNDIYWYAPIVADAEAGFGGPLHAFELMKAMIDAGAAGVHFEDQLAAGKRCSHMGGKVLVPTSQFVRTLNAARLASDVLEVPTVLIARTDALDATLLTSDIDPADNEHMTGQRTPEGYYVVRNSLESTIARALSYAPYADMLWFESSRPNLEEARIFADAIHSQYPGKLLMYNCSPSFNWKHHLDDSAIETFQDRLAEMGYKFQFITLAGWHMVNYHAFEFAKDYRKEGLPAFVRLQEQEFAGERHGYTATKHQHEVGASYFDQVLLTITEGKSSTSAMEGSTEADQFE